MFWVTVPWKSQLHYIIPSIKTISGQEATSQPARRTSFTNVLTNAVVSFDLDKLINVVLVMSQWRKVATVDSFDPDKLKNVLVAPTSLNFSEIWMLRVYYSTIQVCSREEFMQSMNRVIERSIQVSTNWQDTRRKVFRFFSNLAHYDSFCTEINRSVH